MVDLTVPDRMSSFVIPSVPFMKPAFLSFAILLLLIPLGAAAKPMNVIMIMADDSAADNSGCYGSTFFRTPRLDQLAKTGVRFTHAYSTPVCTPSRVKIMTGRSGIRNYVEFGSLDKGEVAFGTMMKKAGYATAIAGKWQLDRGPNGSLAADAGFDQYCLWNYPGAKGARFWNPNIIQNGEKLATTDKDYGPDIFSEFLIDFIVENKDRPFFAYYPMVLVHSPFDPTPKSTKPEKPLSKEEQTLRNYQDMVAYMDYLVGRIVDTLEEQGLRGNTVIIFTADNGTDRRLSYPYKEETRQGQKGLPLDGGTHVPLIVNAPGILKSGPVSHDLVDFSDFFPTIAEITDTPLPDVTLDGRSFWPQCLGQKGNPRKWIYQYHFPKRKSLAEPHGQGINEQEVVWAQNQDYKLYRNGTLHATKDRQEQSPILPEEQTNEAKIARELLQKALDAMPQKAGKLNPTKPAK